MNMPAMSPMSSMEDKHKEMLKKMGSLRKTSPIAEKVFKKEEKEYSNRCWMARMLLDEALEEYEEGDLEWDAMVEDLTKTLKAMSDITEESMMGDGEEETAEEED